MLTYIFSKMEKSCVVTEVCEQRVWAHPPGGEHEEEVTSLLREQ